MGLVKKAMKRGRKGKVEGKRRGGGSKGGRRGRGRRRTILINTTQT